MGMHTAGGPTYIGGPGMVLYERLCMMNAPNSRAARPPRTENPTDRPVDNVSMSDHLHGAGGAGWWGAAHCIVTRGGRHSVLVKAREAGGQREEQGCKNGGKGCVWGARAVFFWSFNRPVTNARARVRSVAAAASPHQRAPSTAPSAAGAWHTQRRGARGRISNVTDGPQSITRRIESGHGRGNAPRTGSVETLGRG